MQTYKVEFKKSAVKELARLPRKTQSKIIKAIKLLQLDPYSEVLPIRKMRGHSNEDRLRMRVGDYRIIYQIQKQQVMISIVRIGHRKDVYR